MENGSGLAGLVLVLAAGQGKRMRSRLPKVLQPLCGRPMIAWALEAARSLGPERVCLVVGSGADLVRAAVDAEAGPGQVGFALQAEQLGTGHAVSCARAELEAHASVPGPVVVLYGDMPLLSAATLERLCRVWRAEAATGACLLTAVTDQPRGFGRIVRDPGGPGVGGPVRAIVEERDASPQERAIPEVNVGVYAFAPEVLLSCLPRLCADNAQGEYYLTDVVGMCIADGLPVATVELDDLRESIGVNTLAHLAEARTALQERILEEHLAAGVVIEDPATTYIDYGVQIGARTRVLPCTVIRAGVVIGEGCEVGPFTHLRAGTVLADGAEVGNFTECENARVGRGTKAKHLSYLGDVTIGERANVGAGTIVANYDGVTKHPSEIGDGAFIGSGSILIAPTRVGARAITGAGAVVKGKSDIPPGEVWVGVPARPLARRQPAGSSERGAEGR